jgi:hypothetical protein
MYSPGSQITPSPTLPRALVVGGGLGEGVGINNKRTFFAFARLPAKFGGLLGESKSYPVGPHGVRNNSPPRCKASSILSSV